MNYNVKSGDCLWNIVKANYNVKSDNQIISIINEIKDASALEDINIINPGNKLVLPENEHFINFNSAPKAQNKADLFDDWTNIEAKNNEVAQKLEDIEEFEMFDEFDLKTYSADLKEFAQDYVNKYDKNGDGTLDREEFIEMAIGGNEIPKGKEKEFTNMLGQKFDDLNIDDDKDHISAEEYASMLYTADLDWYNYNGNNVAEVIDGKLNYTRYQALPELEGSTLDFWKKEKADFFNHFYKKDEAAEPEKSKESANTSGKVDYTYTAAGGKEISVNVPDGWKNMTQNGDKITFEYPDGSKITTTIKKSVVN